MLEKTKLMLLIDKIRKKGKKQFAFILKGRNQSMEAYKEFRNYIRPYISYGKQDFNLISLKGEKYLIEDFQTFLKKYVLGCSKGMKISLAQPIRPDTSFLFFQDLDCRVTELNHKKLKKIIKKTIQVLKEKLNMTHVSYLYDKSSTKNRYHVYYYNGNGDKIFVDRNMARSICFEVISKIPSCAKLIDTNYSGCRLPLSYKWIKNRDPNIRGYWDPSIYMSGKYDVAEVERRLLY